MQPDGLKGRYERALATPPDCIEGHGEHAFRSGRRIRFEGCARKSLAEGNRCHPSARLWRANPPFSHGGNSYSSRWALSERFPLGDVIEMCFRTRNQMVERKNSNSILKPSFVAVELQRTNFMKQLGFI